MKRLIICIIIITNLLIQIGANEDYPQRIITTAPNLTEIAFYLGLGERIVGVSDYCQYPPEAKKKERIGGYLNPSIETIMRLHPDLIILPETEGDYLDKLETMKMNILEVPNETLSHLMNAITLISEKTGVPERGKKLRQSLQKDLDEVRKRHKNHEPVPTLIIVGRSPDSLKDIYAAAPGTFLDKMLSLAGGENVLKEQPALYPKLSKESLLAMNPRVIIETTLAKGVSTTNTIHGISNEWKALGSIEAVKKDKVYRISDPSFTIQGPRMIKNIRILSDLLHPEKE